MRDIDIASLLRRDLAQIVVPEQRRPLSDPPRSHVARLVLGATLLAILALSPFLGTRLASIREQSGAEPRIEAGGPGQDRPVVIEKVRALTAEVRRIDRIEAKLVQARDLPASVTQGAVQADREVWVVAVAGDIRPAFAHGRPARWGAYLYDKATKEPVSSAAGDLEAWPPFFDALADRVP